MIFKTKQWRNEHSQECSSFMKKLGVPALTPQTGLVMTDRWFEWFVCPSHLGAVRDRLAVLSVTSLACERSLGGFLPRGP